VTTENDPHPLFSDATARATQPARARRTRTPALCVAMLCAGTLWAGAQARTPRAPRAASTPSTAQILAPSAAAVPDALPPDRTIYRCGNSYSARPCGDAPPLDVADARSPAQRLQAEDVAARDKRLASWLEAGRHERERAASPERPRVARASTACADTAANPCKPKKPRPPHAAGKTPKAAASAAKG
jgi:hypothetical protein